MPAAGPKRKPPGQTVTRHVGQEYVDVENVPFLDGPKLQPRHSGREWPPSIPERWRIWSSMPHCKLWGEAEWQFARDALEAAAQMIESDYAPTRCAEVRNREKIMGTTMDYRRDIRIRYVDPKPVVTSGVAKLDDYRAL